MRPGGLRSALVGAVAGIAACCPNGQLKVDGRCVAAECGAGRWTADQRADGRIFADANAASGGDGSAGSPVGTLEEALALWLERGEGTIALAAGTYAGPIDLDDRHDGLAIEGRCADLVEIEAPLGEFADWPEGQGSVLDAAVVSLSGAADTDVALSGLAIRGGDTGGIWVTGATATLDHLFVFDTGYLGVVADEGATVSLTNSDVSAVRPSPEGDAIAVLAVDDSALSVAHTVVHDTPVVGLGAWRGGSLTVVDTAVRNLTANGEFGASGLLTALDATVFLSDVEFEGLAGDGIALAGLDDDTTSVEVWNTTMNDIPGYTFPDGTEYPGSAISGYGSFALRIRNLRSEGAGIGILVGSEEEVRPTREFDIDGAVFLGGDHAAPWVGVLLAEQAKGTLAHVEIGGGYQFGMLFDGQRVKLDVVEPLIDGLQAYPVAGYTDQYPDGAAFGLSVSGDATVRVTGGSIADVPGVSVSAGSGCDLTLTDLVVRDGRAIPYLSSVGTIQTGLGLICADATLRTDGLSVTNVAGPALIVGQGCVTDAQRSEFIGPDDWGDTFSNGTINVSEGGILTGSDVRATASPMGMVLFNGTATLQDLVVTAGSTPDAGTGKLTGVYVTDGGRATLTGGAIEGVPGIGVWVACDLYDKTGAECEATLDGIAITDVTADPANSDDASAMGIGALGTGATVVAQDVTLARIAGPGIVSAWEALVHCDGCTIEDVQFAGAVVSHGLLQLDRDEANDAPTTIRGVRPHPTAGGGAGLLSYFGSAMWLFGTEVSDVTIAAVYLDGSDPPGVGSYYFSEVDLEAPPPVEVGGRCCFNGNAIFAGGGLVQFDNDTHFGLGVLDSRLHGSSTTAVLLDDASGIFQDMTYEDNAVDVTWQSCGTAEPPRLVRDRPTTLECPEGEDWMPFLPFQSMKYGWSADPPLPVEY